MARSPAEVSMRRHSPQLTEREQLSSDTTRFSSTTESYRAMNRQLEKKPGRIWSVTSSSAPADPMFEVLRECGASAAGGGLAALSAESRLHLLRSYCAQCAESRGASVRPSSLQLRSPPDSRLPLTRRDTAVNGEGGRLSMKPKVTSDPSSSPSYINAKTRTSKSVRLLRDKTSKQHPPWGSEAVTVTTLIFDFKTGWLKKLKTRTEKWLFSSLPQNFTIQVFTIPLIYALLRCSPVGFDIKWQ